MPLKLVKRPRSPHWIIRGSIRGIRVEESTGVSHNDADKPSLRAEEVRSQREAELFRESVYGRQATATFGEAALSYMQATGNRKFMEPVIRHFGTMPLAQIDQEALDKGAAKLYPHGGPATRNRQFFTPVSAVLHHAAKRKWCARPLIERPKQPNGRIRWITPEEAERLIGSASDHLRPLMVFLLYTGARIGEALWLDWRNVDLKRAHVVFPKTKNGEARGVPLHSRVVASLTAIKGREGEVFRRPDGAPYERPARPDDTSAGRRIRTAFDGACRRAKITDFTPHDCRHTWATWHYARNRDLMALKRLGGWKSERMVMRYAHVNVGELAHTIDRLPGGNLGDDDAPQPENP